MQHHQVHKCTILVPHFWFIKQQVEKGGSKAGGKVIKAKFLFWNSPFWTLSCCSVWNILSGLPSHSCRPPQGVCELRLPDPVVVPTQTSQPSVLWASAPAASALLLASGISVVVCLLNIWTLLSLSAFAPSVFLTLEKGLLLYREMDLTVWRKQVTSHHYI